MLESYIDERARGVQLSYTDGSAKELEPLSGGAYPIPRFTRYSDYWSTGLHTDNKTGRGLANYSNRGFFTAAKNFLSTEYDSPSSNLNDYTIETTTLSFPGTQGAVKKEYLKGPVHDTVSGSDDIIRMTTRGLFVDTLNELGMTTFDAYTLDSNNYDDQASLLIPRAVAYSAGILDYFFRGQMGIALPDAGAYAVVDQHSQGCKDSCGFTTIKLKLTNKTPNEDMDSGLLVAVVKFHRNTCYRPDLSGDPGGANFSGVSCRSDAEEIAVSNPIDIWSLPNRRLGPGEQQPITFSFASPIPSNATDVYLQVVFRGSLGNEVDAVAVATKDISEPNYIAYSNISDYVYDFTKHAYFPLPYGGYTAPIIDSQIEVRLGDAIDPIATLSQLSVRQYAELAYLTDKGSEWVRVNSTRNSTVATEEYVHNAEFVMPAGGQNYYRTIALTPTRGVASDYLKFSMLPPTSGPPYQDCQSEPQMCDQSALVPALTPASIVEWTIRF